MPQSLRKHNRKEKARIRRDFSDIEEQANLINELYKKFLKQDENTGNIQSNNK